MDDFICGLLRIIMDKMFPSRPRRPTKFNKTAGMMNSKI